MRVFLAIIFLLFNNSAYSESLKIGAFEEIEHLYDKGEILVCEEVSYKHFKTRFEIFDTRISSKKRVVFIINDDTIVETSEKSILYYVYHSEKSEKVDPIKKIYQLNFFDDRYYRITYNKVSNSIYMEKLFSGDEKERIRYNC